MDISTPGIHTNNLKLTISPHIDQQDTIKGKTINTLEKFLATVDSSITSNIYWEKSDFGKYVYLYMDIYGLGKRFSPTLLEIINTQKKEEK